MSALPSPLERGRRDRTGALSGGRPLRIASICRILPSPEDPAAGTFVANRLAALSCFADVRAIQPVPYFPLIKPLPRSATAGPRMQRELTIEPAPMFYLPGFLKSADGLWLERSARRTLARMQHQWEPDVIDAHFGYPEGVGSVRLAMSLGRPAFVTVRGSETDLLRTPGIREQLTRSLMMATGCICVSHSLCRLLEDHGVPAERLRVIPNAVDRVLFRPGSREQARQALGIPDGVRLIVSVGHLISGKRHHVLVRALAALSSRRPDVQLAIIGGKAYEREYPAELARVIRALGLDERVRVLGRLPQSVVGTWLQAADVFALATEREGCCNAVLEALAAGRPVVTTPAGDNAQFVKPSLNGVLVPIDDIAGFERALDDALGRKWDADVISNSLDVGNWDNVARRVLAFLTERLECV